MKPRACDRVFKLHPQWRKYLQVLPHPLSCLFLCLSFPLFEFLLCMWLSVWVRVCDCLSVFVFQCLSFFVYFALCLFLFLFLFAFLYLIFLFVFYFLFSLFVFHCITSVCVFKSFVYICIKIWLYFKFLFQKKINVCVIWMNWFRISLFCVLH